MSDPTFCLGLRLEDLPLEGNLVESRLRNFLNFDRLTTNMCSALTSLTVLNRVVRCTKSIAGIFCPNLIPPLFTLVRFNPRTFWILGGIVVSDK